MAYKIKYSNQNLEKNHVDPTFMGGSLGTLLHLWGLFQITQVPTPPPTPQTTLDTCIENVSTLDTTIKNWVEWGKGELQEYIKKDALFNEGTQN